MCRYKRIENIETLYYIDDSASTASVVITLDNIISRIDNLEYQLSKFTDKKKKPTIDDYNDIMNEISLLRNNVNTTNQTIDTTQSFNKDEINGIIDNYNAIYTKIDEHKKERNRKIEMFKQKAQMARQPVGGKLKSRRKLNTRRKLKSRRKYKISRNSKLKRVKSRKSTIS